MRCCRPCRVPRRRRRPVDTLGLELGGESKYHLDIKDDDPTSAVAEMRRVATRRRGDWQVRFETSMRLTCTRDAFRLQASLSAREGDEEVCQREWDCAIPRDLCVTGSASAHQRVQPAPEIIEWAGAACG